MVNKNTARQRLDIAPAGFKQWLLQRLETRGVNASQWLDSLRPMPGDAGFRHYYLFDCVPQSPEAGAYIAVFSPPETEKNREFLQIAEHFRVAGVCVPQVFASDVTRGYFLLENFGAELYLDRLSSCNLDDAGKLYRAAFAQLLNIQRCRPKQGYFPPYDQAFLHRELCLFDEWFVGKLLQKKLSTGENRQLSQLYSVLECSALQQPQVVVHRDFHSRNILYRPRCSPGIIDFQDAVTGAVTYDLVSLLRDCYIDWPEERVEAWALTYAAMAKQAGVLQDFTSAAFLRAFDLMGLQRHIKVLGIFSRLFLRDNKQRYLSDLPRVMQYIGKVSAKYPELADFSGWFTNEICPLAERAEWMDRGDAR